MNVVRSWTATAKVVALVFAGVLVAACNNGDSPGAFQSAACPVPNLPGVPSANLGPEFSCGYLAVPENRNVPNGRTIRILIVRAKAATATPKADPIVFLHGGPGGIASIEAQGIVAGGMNADREVIFVNQRGGLHNEPHLSCPEVDRFDAEAVGLVYQDPATAALDGAAIAACRQRLAATTDADLTAFGTLANAADFEDLRVALGIEQWNVYGVSYGAYLAQQLARDYPKGIRTLTLDSVLPPTVNIVDKWWEAPASGFKSIFQACADQPACAAAYPDLETVFNATVNELAQAPVHVTVTGASGKAIQVTIDGFKLVPLILDWSANSKVVDIPRMIYNIATGDGTIAAAAIAVAAEVPVEQQGLLGSGLALDAYCQDMANWTTPQQALSYARMAMPAFPDSVLQIAPTGSWMFRECAAWDINRSDSITHTPAISAVPTLILSGTFDTKTAPAWIAESTPGLRNNVVVHFPGVGHGVLPSSKCGQSIMTAFIEKPSESVDTSCVAHVAVPTFATP